MESLDKLRSVCVEQQLVRSLCHQLCPDFNMEQRMNLKFCGKLQKSPTGQMPIHGMESEEFPQVKEATDVKFQDQNNDDRISFYVSGYHPLSICTRRDRC
jgi:hypothetical protein